MPPPATRISKVFASLMAWRLPIQVSGPVNHRPATTQAHGLARKPALCPRQQIKAHQSGITGSSNGKHRMPEQTHQGIGKAHRLLPVPPVQGLIALQDLKITDGSALFF